MAAALLLVPLRSWLSPPCVCCLFILCPVSQLRMCAIQSFFILVTLSLRADWVNFSVAVWIRHEFSFATASLMSASPSLNIFCFFGPSHFAPAMSLSSGDSDS